MAKEIFMPKLSSTMEIGTLLQWFKEEGDTIHVGEPLFEIMTDKINIEVESYEDGILLKKYYQADDEVPVNTIIGYTGEAGEEVPEQPPQGEAEEKSSVATQERVETIVESLATGNEKVRATPAARYLAKEHDLVLNEVVGTGPKGRIQKTDVLLATEEQPAVKATPLARKIAADEQMDLNNVIGSGSNGKIYRKDLPVANSSISHKGTTILLQGLRKTIAKRMTESVQTIPHVTLHTEVNMEQVVQLRKQLLPVIEQVTEKRLSYTEILMKAVAVCLSRHPMLNTTLEADEIHVHSQVNIGLAVAIDNGLIVPVIKNVGEKGLQQLTVEAKEITQRARSQSYKSEDIAGGTFTISNLGMYDIDGFTPIINPPQTAILGIGRIVKKPVVVGEKVEVQSMMTLSLSFDHRVVDGAPAAAFLSNLKRTLEEPFQLLL
ncbi:2-oxo acid dehydrogenase subunit E2 [Radiobacillus kanasensis]|uniref:dihydrolipoamide acetyltransferase family protein n=1 Tax=Radiobacillus kanasensis TaxID=2844358 RepID=UPI001E4D62CE|nr:dihydrolipoamide acetyltransferase family protein [Radiobacillus kanasensis]UFT98607.1 2-oxo acid dehydrogenase subunit E2 [Radiobacillus kanasensis]